MIYLACCLISLFLFFLYNWTYLPALWLHLSLSPFVHGVSGFKINFILIYSALLSLIALVPWGLKNERIITWLRRINIISVCSALMAVLLSFIFFIHRFSLPPGKYAYHFKGAYNSLNYYSHIHTGKAAIFRVLDLLGLQSFNEISDTGVVFADYVSSTVVLLIVVSVVVSFLTFVVLLKPMLGRWAPERRIFVFLIYAFASVHVLKCSVDGGPLSYDLLPSLIALHLLYLSGDPASLAANFKRWRLVYLLAVAGVIGITSYVSIDDVLHLPIGLAFMGSVYFLLFVPLLNIRLRSPFFIVALSICTAVTAGYWLMHGWEGIDAFSSTLSAEGRVMYFSYAGEGPAIEDETAEMHGRSLAEIYRALGDNPVRNRNTALLQEGEKNYTGFIFALKLMRNDGKIRLESDSLMHIDELSKFEDYGENAYLMKVSFNPDYFPPLWGRKMSIILQNNRYCMLYFLNHYFQGRGIKEYAIIPFFYFEVK